MSDYLLDTNHLGQWINLAIALVPLLPSGWVTPNVVATAKNFWALLADEGYGQLFWLVLLSFFLSVPFLSYAGDLADPYNQRLYWSFSVGSWISVPLGMFLWSLIRPEEWQRVAAAGFPLVWAITLALGCCLVAVGTLYLLLRLTVLLIVRPIRAWNRRPSLLVRQASSHKNIEQLTDDFVAKIDEYLMDRR